jgi:hypothetical protein
MSENTERPDESEDLPEDDGVLDPDDTLETDDLSADPLDTGISPPDRHPASERYGVTLAESRSGESLDARLAEEEPDFGAPGGRDGRAELEEDEPQFGDDEPDARAGRLVAEDEGAHSTSDRDYLGRDIGIDGGAASAEEAAMHVVGDDEQDDEDGADGADEWQAPWSADR